MIIGSKKNRRLYENLFKDNLPSDINDRIYIEPFGGSFGLYKLISRNYTPKMVVYNDLKNYGFDIDADKVLFEDYRKILREYNTEDAFFYIDPPYIGKEDFYEKTFEGINDHIILSEEIKNLKGKWMLSYQDNKLLKEWYSDFNISYYQGDEPFYADELVITNY